MENRKNLPRKALALLLCLSMLFSTVSGALVANDGAPKSAGDIHSTVPLNESDGYPSDLPAEIPDLPAENPSAHDSATDALSNLPADTLSVSIPGDGARDTWAQNPNTIRGTGALCELTADGKLHLKSSTSNGNNAGTTATPPAVFFDATLDAALVAATDEKTLSFDLTTPGTTPCFGIFLNYVAPATNGAAVNGILIGYNTPGGWFAQFYGGNNVYPNITDLPLLTSNQSYNITLSWTDTKVTLIQVDESVGTIPNNETNVKTVTDSLGVVDKVGIKVGKGSTGAATELLLSNIKYTGQADATAYSVAGTVTDSVTQKPLKGAGVTIAGKTATTDAEGKYAFTDDESFLPGTYTGTVVMDEYLNGTLPVTVEAADIAAANVALAPVPVNSAVISSDRMDVKVDLDFPRVIQYTMKGGKEDGKIFYGQTAILDTIMLNGSNPDDGVAVKPTVVSSVSAAGDKVTYSMFVKGTNIDAMITAELVVVGNTLSFNITDVLNSLDRLKFPIESIYIPNHSLVSVRSTQPGAAFKGAMQASNTTVSGDVDVDVVNGAIAGQNDKRYLFGFVSNDELSAGLASNSDYGTQNAGKDTYAVTLSAVDKGSYQTLGMGSSLWYYDRKTTSSDNRATMNRDIKGEMTVIAPMPNQLPLFAKISIGGEANGDGKVDWQDGAIAYRDTIMHKPANSDTMAEVVSTRIAMNFGSQAQNPFLTTLDNAKRLALHTDGLGQAILLKGYGSEGHDSGHPDYGNVGERMGGAADFNTLTQEGKKIGAHFGIHINASEFYPEAKAFSEELVQYNTNDTVRFGWNWIDQGVGINALYDLASGERAARFDELYKAVGNYENGGLDFVYLDVWGNGQGGKEDSWQTRKISEQIISHGWRIAHEWSWANPYESTFQHWTGDFGYGDYSAKGALNSAVMRFLLNSRKDSFVPDFAWFGGAANAPLLGGPSMQGFEGWQGDGEYDMASYNVFNQMIPTKFLQHYDIMKWTNNNVPVAIPYAKTAGDSQTLTSDWTPEVQLELARNGDKVVVTRGLDETIDDTYAYGTTEEQIAYRSRTITLNGKVVLKGAPKAGDFKLPVADTMQYLIPWYWDNDGKLVALDQEKLYHWNALGGETTWDLPEDWANLTTVNLYKLTDTGRTEETAVPVVNGKLTLNVTAETPYLVARGKDSAPKITFTAAGTHLVDMSFNAGTLEPNWIASGKGTATIVKTAKEIPVLKLVGEVSVSQTLTDLVPGQAYAAYVGVDNRSDAKASITITADKTELANNFSLRSIAPNYISAYVHAVAHPVEAGTSLFQNMYVFFTAPASGTTTLTLSRAAGAGNTYFDDVRVLETKAQNYTYGADGKVAKFTQDFENVAQGEYPFVVGPIEGMADNRQHLSELHAPYTQSGWKDLKRLDDVLEGNWSLKVNGLCSRKEWATNVAAERFKAGLTFQTIPQTFYFEPGVTYNIAFDYQMGSAGTYELVTGVGAYNADTVSVISLKEALGNAEKKGVTQTVHFSVIGDASGQTWFGIRSTRVFADYDPTATVNQTPTSATAPNTFDQQNFGGYKDFILDNLVIEVSKTSKDALGKLLAVANGMVQEDYAGNWAAFVSARTFAQTIMNNQVATQAQIDAVTQTLKTTLAGLTKQICAISGTITNDTNTPVAGAVITLEDTDYSPVGASAVTDANGKYSFVDQPLRTYKIKVSAHGYDVQTTADITTAHGTPSVKDVTLAPIAKATYVNNFDSGDVSMMKAMESKNDSHMSAEAVQYGGSGAVKITFIDSSSRDINNLVDKTIMMKNGALSADITPVGAGTRFGFTLRGTSGTSRVFVGQFDTEGVYGWEYWGPNGTKYSTTNYVGPALSQGVTRHLELELTDNTLTLKVDGVTIMDAISLVSGQNSPPATAGYVGFNKERSTGKFIIDNFHLTSSDPAASGSQQISGKVLGEGNAPVVDAVVTVMQDTTFMARTTTSLDGTYLTAAVPAGVYSMVISASSYTTQTVTATVTADGTLNFADITLVVDSSALQALYDANKGKQKENYTDASWTVFQTALEGAKTALETPSAATLSAAYAALDSALTALTENTLDMSLLRTYYNAYNGYVDTGYTPDSWAAFQSALRDAAAVLNNSSAKQAQVDAACAALQAAYSSLSGGSTGEIPSGGGSGTGGSSTTTTKNEDGSTTTSVTNKKTGTITETTTAPNGAKTVATVKTDGSVSAQITLPKSAEGKLTISMSPLPIGTSSVTVVAEKPVIVTIPVKNATPGTVAVLVKADGTELIVRKSLSGDGSISVPLDGSATLTFKDNTKRFSDVPSTHWATDAVTFVASRELFQGTGEGMFSPEAPMNRAMLVTVLYRLENEPKGATPAFADVPAGTWYTDAVAWANESELVTGTGNGFNPNGEITRESLAVILYRYAGKLGLKAPTVELPVSTFSDAASISTWANDAMAWAVSAGVLTGKGGNLLAPSASASRAEVSTMLQRFVGLL